MPLPSAMDGHLSIAQHCVHVGEKIEPEHMMTCRQGGYLSLRHNKLRDLTASMMAEVFDDVQTEPKLQPVTDECLLNSANRSEEARLHVRVRGFWGTGMQEAFFLCAGLSSVRFLIPKYFFDQPLPTT